MMRLSLETSKLLKDPREERITDQWDREDSDNAWFLPDDMGDQ